MIVAKTGIKKKKLIIYLVIITVMVGVNVAIYLNNSRSSFVSETEIISFENLVSPDQVGTNDQVDTKQIIKTSPEQSPLEHTLFNTLKKIGDWPVIPKSIGKSDPFAPFFSSP